MKFIDSFWSTDFTSTAGFDALVKRMKDGRQTCKDMEELIKSRAKAEETYGKELVRFAKKAGNSQETGTIKESWEALVRHTEDIGNMHITMAMALQEEVKKLETFKENQKKKRQQHEESVIKNQNYKKECYNKTMTAKRNYESKCKEADSLDEQYTRAQQTSPQQKDLEKLMQKKTKARGQASQADGVYKTSIETTESARKMWEKEMETCCEAFQALEEDRIEYLRNSMWIYSNLGSKFCVEDDKIYEEARSCLENCSVEEDIANFIQLRGTGSAKPATIDYKCFYPNGTAPSMAPSANKVTGPLRPSKSTISRRPPQPLPGETENPLYDSIENFNGKSSQNKLKRARRNYLAKGSNELSMTEGDLVNIIENLDSQWSRAEINGKTGIVHAECLEDLDPNNATIL